MATIEDKDEELRALKARLRDALARIAVLEAALGSCQAQGQPPIGFGGASGKL